ncbi:MAG: PEP/pyruvate-binding domain-containing protein, partial [Candidatus Omnitrophica bacterium]|nr:PEP/pyruvate-binding domain-containing protein [Candidatus Omnitrophota bacterium]
FAQVKDLIISLAEEIRGLTAGREGKPIVLSCLGEEDLVKNWSREELRRFDRIDLHMYGEDPTPTRRAADLSDLPIYIGEVGWEKDGKPVIPSSEEFAKFLREVYGKGYKGVAPWMLNGYGIPEDVIKSLHKAPEGVITPKPVPAPGKVRPINWLNSLVAAGLYIGTAMTIISSLSGWNMPAMQISILAASLYAVGTLYLMQAADMSFGLFDRVKSALEWVFRVEKEPFVADRLIKPFQRALDAEPGRSEMVYVKDGAMYVDKARMAERPKAIQFFYATHEALHMGGKFGEPFVYAVQGAVLAGISWVLINAGLTYPLMTSVAIVSFGLGALIAQRLTKYVLYSFDYLTGAKDKGTIDPINTKISDYPKALGTVGVTTDEYRRNHSERRARADVFLGQRYTLLGLDRDGKLGIHTQGKNAAKDVTVLKDRLSEINSEKRYESFRKFLSENSKLLDNLQLFLLEAEPGSPDADHPHLMTCDGREWQVSMAGTREGRGQVVYMTRAFFEGMPIEDVLLKVLEQEIKRAVLLYHHWHVRAGMQYPAGEHTPQVQGLLNSISAVDAVREEIETTKRNMTRMEKRYRVDEKLIERAKVLITELKQEIGDIGAFAIILSELEGLTESARKDDYDMALEHWGVAEYEMLTLMANPGDVGNKLRASSVMEEVNGIRGEISDKLKLHVVDYGIYNHLGLEQGQAVGRVLVIKDADKVLSELDRYYADFKAKNGREAEENEFVIVVIPGLDMRLPYLRVKGVIVATAGNDHALNMARGQAIPLAMVPNATTLLESLNGRMGMLRVEEDKVTRVRPAHVDEIKHAGEYKRPRPQQTITVPKAVVGPQEELAFDISEVDMFFVNRVGVKAAHLGHMMKMGLNEAVPAGMVFTFAFSNRFFNVSTDGTGMTLGQKIEAMVEEMKRTKEDGILTNFNLTEDDIRKLGEIRELIISSSMDEELVREITKSADMLRARYGDRGFFVRSSFNFEDLPEVSAAGHYESYPDHEEFTEVRTNEQVVEAVRRVMAQKYSEAAFRMRLNYKVPESEVYPGIILQVPAMGGKVSPDKVSRPMVSGVMKTYEPVSRDKGEVQIEGSFGTGAVVSGQGEPATILVNKVTG